MATTWSVHIPNTAGIFISVRTGLGTTRRCAILDAAVRHLGLCSQIMPLASYNPAVVGTITLQVKLDHLDFVILFEVVRHISMPMVASLGIQFLREEHAQVCLSRRILTLRDDCEIPLAESHDVRRPCLDRCRCYYLGRDF